MRPPTVMRAARRPVSRSATTLRRPRSQRRRPLRGRPPRAPGDDVGGGAPVQATARQPVKPVHGIDEIRSGAYREPNLKIKNIRRIARATTTSDTRACDGRSTTDASAKITHRRRSEPAVPGPLRRASRTHRYDLAEERCTRGHIHPPIRGRRVRPPGWRGAAQHAGSEAPVPTPKRARSR
jgi:hypothetical protein